MTKILAIDASSEACSVALLDNSEIIERYDVVPRKHTELILPMVDEVLSEAGISFKQLDALAFNRGPGSFTGVRISTSVIQGLSFATELPVLAVSGLAAVAQNAWRTMQQDNVIVMLDARMDEVYWGYFQADNGYMKPISPEHVGPVSGIDKPGNENWMAVGSGIKVYNNEVAKWSGQSNLVLNTDILYPRASDIAVLARHELDVGNIVNAMQAQPVYLREKVV